MNECFLNNTFFPIVRAGMGISIESVPEQVNYPLLIEIAGKQAILPIIREGLAAMQLKGDEVDVIEKKCEKDIFFFAQRDLALDSVKSCFERNGIEYVLLKGSVLRDLYPDKWMRTSCDIDVLIKEDKLERAVEVLQKETDFKFIRKLYHDVSMSSPNVHLELHFNIKENMDNIDKLLSEVWNYAVRQQGTNQFVLTPEYQIFHIVAHMTYHFVHGGIGVRPYLDLWLLRKKTKYDESIVREMCDSCGILKFYEECCNLSGVWLEKKEHTSITKALEQYSFDGGVFGNRKNAAISELSKNQGYKYFIRRAFVKRQSLEIEYPNLKKHPSLLPFYQVKRWFNAVFYKRNKVKNELHILRHTDDEEIASIKKLFECVGL